MNRRPTNISMGKNERLIVNGKENKYERFERWLHENHAQFSMVR